MFFAVANTIMRAAMSTIAPIAAFIWNLNFNRYNLETRVWDLGGPPPPPPFVWDQNTNFWNDETRNWTNN